MQVYVPCSVIYSSQEMEAAQVLIYRQLDKEVVTYIMEYYLAINKNEILPFVTIGGYYAK